MVDANFITSGNVATFYVWSISHKHTNTRTCMDNLDSVDVAMKRRREKLEINSEKAIHHLLNNADFHTPLQNMEN